MNVSVSPTSTSAKLPETSTLYAVSSVAVSSACAVARVGASLVLVTVRSNVSVTDAVPSLAVTTTVDVPTSALTGVPDSTPAVDIVIVEGIPVAVYVSTSLASPDAKLPEISKL